MLVNSFFVFIKYIICKTLVIDGNEIVYRDYVDISVAVAAPKVFIYCERKKNKIKLYFD